MSPRWCCRSDLWGEIHAQLARRGRGQRESGAFLLGQRGSIEHAVYYDDLAPGCLDSGIIVFPSHAYGALWDRCEDLRLRVIGDVHTHPRSAHQSPLDREHPMIPSPGHLALIVPRLAQRPVQLRTLGVYEYLGNRTWRTHSARSAAFLLKEVA